MTADKVVKPPEPRDFLKKPKSADEPEVQVPLHEGGHQQKVIDIR